MLDNLEDRIIARLQADFPAAQVLLYPENHTRFNLPAILLDLNELAYEDEDGGRLMFTARFVAYCLENPNGADAERTVRNFATEVAVRIHQEEDFGADDVTRNANIIDVGPNAFRPELHSYICWAVEFEIGITVGEGVWNGAPADGVPVTTIEVGDLNTAHLNHSMAAGADEPVAEDTINLPDQPKG